MALQTGPLQVICQIFKPATPNLPNTGGYATTAGSPNYLMDLGTALIGATWTDAQLGGVQSATFKLKQQYETVLDIVAGNWLMFGCWGGTTPATYLPGASSIQVLNATDAFGNPYFVTGDSIMISDGMQSEIFKIASLSYIGSLATIGLGPAPSENSSSLLNVFAAGARVVRAVFQGLITQRMRTTEWNLNFSINCMGMFWRYQKCISSFNMNQQDSANVISTICSSFQLQIPEIIYNAANFAPNNNIFYSGTSKNQNVISVLDAVLQNEQGGTVPNSPSEYTVWTMWVDELRQIHHQQVTTVVYTGSAPYSMDLVNGSPYGDVLGPLQTTDMDLTRLVNVVMCNGGIQSDGTQLILIVTHQQSYQQWGYYESIFTNQNITDQPTMTTWAAGQLSLNAWPQTSARLSMKVASGRFNARSLLYITGFTDSSTLYANPTSIQYNIANFKDPVVTAMCTLVQEQPNITSIAREIASQISVRSLQNAVYTNVGSTYIVSGCTFSTSGTTYTLTPGVVVYNGTAYNTPGASNSMSNGQTLYIGFNTVYSDIEYMAFSANFNNLGGQNWVELQNTAPTGQVLKTVAQTNFTGVFLGRLTCWNGKIFVDTSQVAFGGISASRIVFQGLTTQNSTGLLMCTDTNAHYSAQAYQLPAIGQNAVLTASITFQLTGNAAQFGMWLLSTSSSVTQPTGIWAFWDTSQYLYLYYYTTAFFAIANSPAPITKDFTNFHDLTLLCKLANSTTYNIQLMLDGKVQVQGTLPFGVFGATSGKLAVMQRGTPNTVYIDPVNTWCGIESSTSSANVNGQGQIAPAALPSWSLTISSPTYTTSALRLGAVSFVPIPPAYTTYGIQFADGSFSVAPSSGALLVDDSAGVNGVWYFSIGINLSTYAVLFYLSQIAPTSTQLMTFLNDGILPLTVGNTLTVTAGNITTVSSSPPGAPSERWLN